MKDFKRFQALLDEQCQWPSVYTFKFIAPRDSAAKLLTMFAAGAEVSVRESRSGAYLSVTVEKIMSSSAGVIAVYEAVAGIEGLISL